MVSQEGQHSAVVFRISLAPIPHLRSRARKEARFDIRGDDLPGLQTQDRAIRRLN